MKHLFDKQNKYSIRKLSVGVCSAVIGLSLLGAQTAYATENTANTATADSTNTVAANTQATPEPVAVDATYAEGSRTKENAPATNAVDADLNTYWESEPATNGEPTTLTVRMAELARVDSISYAPRQVTTADPVSQNPAAQGAEYLAGHHPGLLTKGKIEHSTDGQSWTPVVLTGIDGDSNGNGRVEADNTFSLGANNRERHIRFEPVDAQYFRLTALQSWRGKATGLSNTGLVTAAKFIPTGVKPTAAPPAEGENPGNGGDTGTTPVTPSTEAIIKKIDNQVLNNSNGNKFAFDDAVKNHLKAATSGTIYMEYRVPENTAFHSLFNATDRTDDNKYVSLYSNGGVVGLEARTNDGSLHLNQGEQRVKNGEWQAVAFSFERNAANTQTEVKLYVNGVLSQTVTSGNRLFTALSDLVHAQAGAAQRAVRGSVWGVNGLELRNLTIFRDALTEEQVIERSAQFKREPYEFPPRENEMVTDKTVVFEGGRNGQKGPDGSGYYRIPALLKTLNGTLIAATDQRFNTYADQGDIATVIRRSTDDGASWQPIIPIVNLRNNPAVSNGAVNSPLTIDAGLVQDPSSKRIYAFMDMFPEGRAVFGLPQTLATREIQYTTIDDKAYLNLYTDTSNRPTHTLRENGVIYDNQGQATEFRVNVEDNSPSYANMGDIRREGSDTVLGNIYFQTNKGTEAPFRVANASYIWLSYSDDDGLTWSRPKDVTPDLKKEHVNFLGIGPGTGIVLHTGPHKGRLIVPAYATNFVGGLSGSQSSMVFYSDDKGETWKAGETVNDNRRLANGTVLNHETMNNSSEQKTEATVVQLNNGDIKMFMRSMTGRVTSATSSDGGATWKNEIESHNEVTDNYVQLSAVRVVREGKEYIVLANSNGPGWGNSNRDRIDGHVRVAEVQEDGRLNWLNHRLIQSGKFAYNSLQYLGDDQFGLIYEHSSGDQNDYTLYYRKFNWDFLINETPKLPDNHVAGVAFEDETTALITFERSVLPTNSPTLLLSNGNRITFLAQRNAKTLVYRIQPTDKGRTILEIASGDISNVNGHKVNVVATLGENSNLGQINNKALKLTASTPDAWQPGYEPDKLFDGKKQTIAELKWDMENNRVDGVYPQAWRLPQSLTVTTKDGQPIDLSAMLISKRINANGTLTKFKVEAFRGEEKVHESDEVAVPYNLSEVSHEFGSGITADRVVLTLLETKQSATGQPTPTMLTLRELAFFGPRTTTREREVLAETLPFTSTIKHDNTKDPDYRHVEVEGVNGSVVKRIRETLVNGVVTTSEDVPSSIRRVEPTNEVVVIGSRVTETRERKVPIVLPFTVGRTPDNNLPEGQEVVDQEGVNGSVVKVYTDTYVNGEKTVEGTEVIREEERVEPIAKKVRFGTKVSTPVDGDSGTDTPGGNQGGGTDTGNTGGDQGSDTDTGNTGGDQGGGTDTGNTGGDQGGGTDTGNTGGDQGGGTDTGNTGGNQGGGTDTGNTGDDQGSGTDAGHTGGDQGSGTDTGTPGAETPPAQPDTPKPVVADETTGVTVKVLGSTDPEIAAKIAGASVAHKETGNQATPSILQGKDYDIFDIELVDKDGNVLEWTGEAKVTLPIDAGKEVAEVIYLPNSEQAEKLDFEVSEGMVTFTAKHFSEYGIVYKTTSTTQPVDTPPSGQPQQPDTTVDIAGLRNELLASIDASDLSAEQKGDLAVQAAFADTASALTAVQAAFTGLLAEHVSTLRNDLLKAIDASGLTDAQKGDLAVKASFAETAAELKALRAELGKVAGTTNKPSEAKPTATKKDEKTLPATGEADSAIAVLGTVALISALGLAGVRRRV